MYTLYLKTSPLGKKYLGYTKRNPYTYLGSGIRWSNHLKANGFGYKDIKTEILVETDSKEVIKEEGLLWSKKLNILDSEEFLNLTQEEGQGGNTAHLIDYDLHFRGSKWMNKDGLVKRVKKVEIETYIQNGWSYGMTEEIKLRHSKKGRVIIPWNKGKSGFTYKKERHVTMDLNVKQPVHSAAGVEVFLI